MVMRSIQLPMPARDSRNRPGMGSWMDLITIYVSPFGALLVAVCIYFVLGMKGIRAELALGRARAPGRLFGITARFYVFLTVAVWILGIAYGGIG